MIFAQYIIQPERLYKWRSTQISRGVTDVMMARIGARYDLGIRTSKMRAPRQSPELRLQLNC
jgi:hypothetical protein